MNDFDQWWSFGDKYWSVINPDDSRKVLAEKLYKHWTSVINFIPEVKPRKAKWAVQDYCIFNKIKPCEVYAGCEWNLRMKPKGAKILLHLFEQRLIEQKIKNASQDVFKLKEYSNISEEEIDKKEKEILTKNRIDKERFEYILEHPDEIKESEMTYDFLNNYSWKKFGKGSHKWQMREYTFKKDFILGMLSNSGKTRVSGTMAWIHVYTWDGNLYKALKNTAAFIGPPRPNRRNDSDRNWGLPEW